MPSRLAYFQECYHCAKSHKPVAVVTAAIALYSFASSIAPLVGGIPPEIASFIKGLPKIPLEWAVMVVLFSVAFIAIEGGFRLREKDRSSTNSALKEIQAQLDKERSIGNAAPDIRIGLPNGLRGFELALCNKSTDKNADAISVERIETNRWKLEIDRVDFLEAGKDITPKVRMFDKENDSQLMDPDYK